MEVEEEPKSKSKSLAKSTCPVALTASRPLHTVSAPVIVFIHALYLHH